MTPRIARMNPRNAGLTLWSLEMTPRSARATSPELQEVSSRSPEDLEEHPQESPERP